MKAKIFAIMLQLVVGLALIGCATSVVKKQVSTVTNLVKGSTSIPDKFIGQWREIEHVFLGVKTVGNSEVSITANQISWKRESHDHPENFKALTPYQIIENDNKIVFMIRKIAYQNTETGEKGFQNAKIEVIREGDILMMVQTSGGIDVSGSPGLFVLGSEVIFRYEATNDSIPRPERR